jgi:cyclohexanecarboxylate-CoA ligase
VVLGTTVPEDEVDFVRHFQQTRWELTHPVVLDTGRPDPDRGFMVLFTSGTSGEPKAVLHTLNTLYASCHGSAAEDALGRQDTFFSPHAITHSLGSKICNLIPLLVGGCALIIDTWVPETALTLVAQTDVTYIAAAPVFISALVAVAREQHRTLPALRMVMAGGTSSPHELVAELPRVLGKPLCAGWGMTEAGTAIWTRPDNPTDWAAHSIGRPASWLEVDLRADHPISAEQPARLLVRGGGICIATMSRDSGELTVIAEHNGGWLDTGDLAVPDGRGGIRLVGRASDRIGGALMIPVSDVETALRTHPAVDDVALVGYPDGSGGELACAVVATRSTPPTLAELRQHLDTMKMTEWYQPRRLEMLQQLPRNTTGKVRKALLRRWLAGEAELPEE